MLWKRLWKPEWKPVSEHNMKDENDLTDAEKKVVERVLRNARSTTTSTSEANEVYDGKPMVRWTVSWGKGSASYFYNESEAMACAEERRSSGKQIRAITRTDLG